MTKVANPNASPRVAVVMRLVAEAIEAEGGEPPNAVSRQVPGDKGSILVEIIVGLGVAATWDAIKYCVRRIGDFVTDSDDVISVDGEERRLGDLESGSDEDR